MSVDADTFLGLPVGMLRLARDVVEASRDPDPAAVPAVVMGDSDNWQVGALQAVVVVASHVDRASLAEHGAKIMETGSCGCVRLGGAFTLAMLVGDSDLACRLVEARPPCAGTDGHVVLARLASTALGLSSAVILRGAGWRVDQCLAALSEAVGVAEGAEAL